MVNGVQLWMAIFFFHFSAELLYWGHALSEQSLTDGDSPCRCRPSILSIVVPKCQGKVPTAKPFFHSLPSSSQRATEGQFPT